MNRPIPEGSIKEYLSSALAVNQQLHSKLDQIAALRTLATQATVHLSDMPRSGSPVLQAMQNVVIKMVDLETEVIDDMDALIDLKRELMELFRRVSSPECQVLLELRYLCFKTWAQIAASLGCNGRRIYKLHQKAIEEIEKIFSQCQ